MTNMKHSIILSAVVASALILVGCTEDKYLVDAENTIQSDVIGFSATIEEGGYSTRSTLDHMSVESETWLVEKADLGAEAATKGAPAAMLSGSVGITAIEYSGTWNEDEVYPNTRMKNDQFTVDGDALVPVNPRAWRNIAQDEKIRFFAYAPYGDAQATVSPMDGTVMGTPYIDYTVTTSIPDQKDLLYAESAEYDNTHRQTVPLTFNHALTAVQFKVGFDCTVRKLTVMNVKNQGRFGKTDGNWGWSPLSSRSNYVVDYGEGQNFTSGQFIADGDNTMMLIPQQLTSALVQLDYLDGDKYDHTILAQLTGVWQMGRKVIYTIYEGAVPEIDYIYFDLAAGNVNITGTTYTGAVYVNGTATTVTGTHEDTNHYYVYQSSTVTGSVGLKELTGYATQADFEARQNCRVPQYPEVTCDGKSWTEYITNNTDDNTVRTVWASCAEAVKRSSTDNSIKALGNNHIYDITIDNIWSSYEETISKRTTGGINYSPTPSGYNDQKNILRVKGDNRVANVMYSRAATGNGYLHLTSYKGDGFSDGSLCTIPYSGKLQKGNGLIGPAWNNTTNVVYALTFNGGTYYASAPLQTFNSTIGSVSCIGGSGNSDGEVIINGGTITAITHSTSAAIGGGGGHGSGGGVGKVTITGGNVYAYNAGVTCSGHGVIPVSAIGGGSGCTNDHAETGIVTITGGNVYAESVGGSAIGGGGSNSANGGKTEVTITGGNVTAISKGGTIVSGETTYTAKPGCAIGGGSTVSGSLGGDAIIRISGGVLNAGSIGGGKTQKKGGFIGTADIEITGGIVSGQFIMANGSKTAPKFKMTDGQLKGSSYPKIQEDGGAVYMETGTCTIEGGTIRDCTARYGGAVYMSGGTFNMSGGTLNRNTAEKDGGAVYVTGGSVVMTGGTVSNNITIDGNGGGVCVQGGSFRMEGPELTTNINYNTANFTSDAEAGNGGGIYVKSTTTNVSVEILQGTVKGNTADRNGGGIGVNMPGDNTADVVIGRPENEGGTILSPYIAENSAGLSGGGLCVEGQNSIVTIKSGTTSGNVSAYVKNEDIRNEGGIVKLEATTDNSSVNYRTVYFFANNKTDPEQVAEQRIVTNTRSLLNPPAEILDQNSDDCFKRDGYHLVGWARVREAPTGSIDYTPEGYVWGTSSYAVMNIAEDVELYAQWALN